VVRGGHPPRPYDQLSVTTHALLAWISEHGHTIGGGLREGYLSDPQHTASEQLVTQRMIKLEEEHA
jgi:effector-binding domain-containing protein